MESDSAGGASLSGRSDLDLRWVDHFTRVAEGQNDQSRLLEPDQIPQDFVAHVRPHAPVPGVHHIGTYTVVLRTGKSVAPHRHEGEWVVMYYVEPPEGSTVWVEGVEIPVVPGQVLLIPPNAEHWVPPNPSPTTRISVAMKVPEIR